MGLELKLHAILDIDVNLVSGMHACSAAHSLKVQLKGIQHPLLTSVGPALKCANPLTDTHTETVTCDMHDRSAWVENVNVMFTQSIRLLVFHTTFCDI